MMSRYVILLKEKKIFKFKVYRGNFGEFLKECKSKVIFKIKLPIRVWPKKRLKASWYRRFCEDMYFLTESGVSITESILIFRNNATGAKAKRTRKFYDYIYGKLLKGNLLCDAFKSSNYKLDKMFLSLLSVSEETGKLSEVLSNLNKYYEEKINIDSKIKSSFAYPTLLFLVLVLMFNLCILIFIPSYVDSFQSQFSNLSTVSLTFINFCLLIKSKYFVFLGLTLGSFVILFGLLKSRKLLNTFVYKIPIFRKHHFRKCQLKFIQILYYIINSGIDITTALSIMMNLGNGDYCNYSRYIYGQVNKGFDFCEALRETKIFDPEIISIINVGERSSNMALVLRNIWTTYSKRHYEKLEKSVKLIEPMFIVICGILILIFIVIFVLPLISYDNFSSIWS